MNALKNPWVRCTFCIACLLLVFAIGFFSTAFILVSNQTWMSHWTDALNIFNKIGLFEYKGGGEDGLDEAVGNSLACFWLPLSALASWWLNRRLKRFAYGTVDVKE